MQKRDDAVHQTFHWPVGLSILLLGLLGVLGISNTPGHWYGGMQKLLTIMAGMLACATLAIWFLFFSGLSRASRRYFALALGAFGFSLSMLLKMDGYYGDLEPRLVWIWELKPSIQRLNDEALQAADGAVVEISLQSDPGRDYPQFMGPRRLARIEGADVHRDWGRYPLELIWEREVGSGWSSFVIMGEYAFTQEQKGEEECVVCYRIEDGGLVWIHRDKAYFSEKFGGEGPRATPTVHEGLVYAQGAGGLLTVLEGITGKVRWQRNILEDAKAKNIPWGMSGSPLVFDDLVLVSPGGAGHNVVAYNRLDGSKAWHAGDEPAAYGSIRLSQVMGQTQALLLNGTHLVAYAPERGELLWRYPWQTTRNFINTTMPLVLGDWVEAGGERIFVSSGYGKGCALLQLERGDTGVVGRPLWENKHLKSKYANMVIADGYIYGLDEQHLVCLRLEDGVRMWKGEKFGFGQMVLIDGILLIQSETGTIYLVDATHEEQRILSKWNALSGKTWNSPAFSKPWLLLRNAQQARCYRWPVVTK